MICDCQIFDGGNNENQNKAGKGIDSSEGNRKCNERNKTTTQENTKER